MKKIFIFLILFAVIILFAYPLVKARNEVSIAGFDLAYLSASDDFSFSFMMDVKQSIESGYYDRIEEYVIYLFNKMKETIPENEKPELIKFESDTKKALAAIDLNLKRDIQSVFGFFSFGMKEETPDIKAYFLIRGNLTQEKISNLIKGIDPEKLSTKNYKDHSYVHVAEDDLPIVFTDIDKDYLLVTVSEKVMFDLLDMKNKRIEKRDLPEKFVSSWEFLDKKSMFWFFGHLPQSFKEKINEEMGPFPFSVILDMEYFIFSGNYKDPDATIDGRVIVSNSKSLNPIYDGLTGYLSIAKMMYSDYPELYKSLDNFKMTRDEKTNSIVIGQKYNMVDYLKGFKKYMDYMIEYELKHSRCPEDEEVLIEE